MKLLATVQLSLLALALPTASGASWGFGDATLSIQPKGAGVGAGVKETLSDKKPLSKAVKLGGADTLKLLLTTKQNGTPQVPHQTFLLLKDQDSGLDISYPLNVKESGKAKVELKQKDLPIQFVRDSKTLDANLVIGSFGSATGYNNQAFTLDIDRDVDQPLPSSDVLRYGKQDEIFHTFKLGPKNPPIVITLVFLAALLAALPVLAGVWLYLGVNTKHLPNALGSSPVSHILFVGSVVSLEAIFFMYYTSWNLFQTLPAVAAVGTVAFVSGSRALSEVQERRVAGLR